MVTKTVIFEAGLEQRIRELSKVNRRSFSSQVVHMIEEIFRAQDAGQAQELRRYMDGCPAAQALQGMVENGA